MILKYSEKWEFKHFCNLLSLLLTEQNNKVHTIVYAYALISNYSKYTKSTNNLYATSLQAQVYYQLGRRLSHSASTKTCLIMIRGYQSRNSGRHVLVGVSTRRLIAQPTVWVSSFGTGLITISF